MGGVALSATSCSCSSKPTVHIENTDNCKLTEDNKLEITDRTKTASVTLAISEGEKFKLDDASIAAGVTLGDDGKTLIIPPSVYEKGLTKIIISSNTEDDLIITLDVPSWKTISWTATTNCSKDNNTINITDRNHDATVTLSLNEGTGTFTIDSVSSTAGVSVNGNTLTIPTSAYDSLTSITVSALNAHNITIPLSVEAWKDINWAVGDNCTKENNTLSVINRALATTATVSLSQGTDEFVLDQASKDANITLTGGTLTIPVTVYQSTLRQVTISSKNAHSLIITLNVPALRTINWSAKTNCEKEANNVLSITDRSLESTATLSLSEGTGTFELDATSLSKGVLIAEDGTLTIPSLADDTLTQITVSCMNANDLVITLEAESWIDITWAPTTNCIKKEGEDDTLEVSDSEEAATATISLSSGSEELVLDQASKDVGITLENGVLTIPAETLAGTQREVTITSKNAHTLVINLDVPVI